MTKKTMSTKAVKLKFNIGADPECQAVLGNYKMSFSALRERYFKGNRLIAQDHNGIVELHPPARKDPKLVAAYIGVAAKVIAEKLPSIQLLTLNQHSPVGGHIHLEMPQDIDINLTELDRFLSTFWLPLVLSENKVSLKQRRQQGYGDILNYRYEPKGLWPDGKPLYTFEFRFPSAEWQISQKIAEATLCYAAMIHNEVLYNRENIIKYRKLIWQTQEQANSMLSVILSSNMAMAKSFLEEIKTAVKTFELYEQYQEEVDYIMDYVQVHKDKEAFDYDIVKGWDIKSQNSPFTDVTTTRTNKTMNAELSERDRTDLPEICINSIVINTDTNMTAIASSIMNYCLKNKMMLKNNYWLYGLRDGIANPIVYDLPRGVIVMGEDIKTTADHQVATNLCAKMNHKFKQRGVEYQDHQVYLIGLPRDWRRDTLNIVAVIKLIAELEENEPHGALTVDADTDRGALYDLVNPKVEPSKLPNIDQLIKNTDEFEKEFPF